MFSIDSILKCVVTKDLNEYVERATKYHLNVSPFFKEQTDIQHSIFLGPRSFMLSSGDRNLRGRTCIWALKICHTLHLRTPFVLKAIAFPTYLACIEFLCGCLKATLPIN